MTAKEKRRRKIALRRRLTALGCLLLVGVIVYLSVVLIKSNFNTSTTGSGTNSISSSTEDAEFKETSATVLSTGDIMVHSPQLTGAYVPSKKTYDFTPYFKAVSQYFKNADLSIANLEVTFGGNEGREYSGYPVFNCPDTLADAIKKSGLNFLITSNNHSYDTGLSGLKRTAKVLKSKEIEFTGTKENYLDPSFVIKEVNNINIGIINYTYETTGGNAPKGQKYLNGISLSRDASPLINSFNYNKIEEFYTEAEERINLMQENGAEFIVFYIHWGNEYQTYPSTHQKAIAQKLCNLGVDVIVGSHPHVVQPMELITSENSQHQTVCLYSTGNAVSNQRQELMDSCPTGHTEDGLLFEFTVKKTKQGVVLDNLKIIPTWVNKYSGGNSFYYTIYPLESSSAINKLGLSSSALGKAKRSYSRTMDIVNKGLEECKKAIGK